MQEFEQTGTRLAQALTQKDVIAKKKLAMSNDVAKALARLSSGLYVVTAANKGARGAMVIFSHLVFLILQRSPGCMLYTSARLQAGCWSIVTLAQLIS